MPLRARRQAMIAIIVVLTIGAIPVITIPGLHPVHYTNNIAFSSGGGQAD